MGRKERAACRKASVGTKGAGAPWLRGPGAGAAPHQLRLQPVVGGVRRRKGKVLVTLLQETVPH